MNRRPPVTALVFCGLLLLPPLFAAGEPLRSLSEIYPGLSRDQRDGVFSEEGLNRSGTGSEGMALLPRTAGNPDIASRFAGKKPSFTVESLRVVQGKKAELLAVYNALRGIRNLKNRVYHSASRDEYVPLFEDATRIESAKRMNPVADPPPASAVPASETIFVRLKDVNFGNCFYEITLTAGERGMFCALTNFKTINYSIVPVMKENAFTAALYIEPVREGLLIYSAATAEVSDFVAGRINIPSALRKRLDVIIGWVIDGVK